jgi:hypothetical protein
MKFPDNFPDTAQASVFAEQVPAAKAFMAVRKDPSRRDIGRGVNEYILRVFSAFAHEACELGLQKVWTANRVNEECREFLRLLCSDVQVEFGELSLPKMTTDMGYIPPKLWSEFIDSEEWKRYQDEFLKVAELQARKPEPAETVALQPRKEGDPVTAGSKEPRSSARKSSPRTFRDPKPELLENAETVNRKLAAQALGMSERSFDRHVAAGKITPLGAGTRKRFNTKELLRFLRRKASDQM